MARLHLNASQRGMVAAELANLGEGRPSKTPQIQGVSTEQAAKLLNVGHASVETAKAVKRDDVACILKTIFADAEWRTIPINQIAKHTRIPETSVRRHHERYVASSPMAKIAKPAVAAD